MKASGNWNKAVGSTVVALAALVLALAAGCGSAGSTAAATTSSAHPSTSTSTNLSPDSASADKTAVVSSSTLARLAQVADEAASAQGGVAKSAEAVRSTRRAANVAMNGDIVDTDPNEAVWAIVVVGKAPFVCADCSVMAGAKAPQGTVITLVVDASSFNGLDSGLGNQVPNLAVLGTPVALPV